MARPSLKKRYGQHHLRSGDRCRPLIDFLQPQGAYVAEIGPGGGVLTRELEAAGASVLAVELDLEWAVHLETMLRQTVLRQTQVVYADARGFPWHRLPSPSLITGNLPFNVGTRLIDESLQAASLDPERIAHLGFMVQKEVAERVVAKPGHKAYGAFSVLVQCRARASWLGVVPARAFRPPPKVDAGFVGLLPHEPICGAQRLDDFRNLVHLAFSRRRKMLRGVLKAKWPRQRVEQALEEIGVDSGARAENLSAVDFTRLLTALD